MTHKIIMALLAVSALTSSCRKAYEEPTISATHVFDGYIISYDFGKKSYCVPLEDFHPYVGTRNKPRSLKVHRASMSLSDAIAVESGRSNTFRFYKGTGKIFIASGGSFNYDLRFFNCNDAFGGLNTLTVYVLQIH